MTSAFGIDHGVVEKRMPIGMKPKNLKPKPKPGQKVEKLAGTPSAHEAFVSKAMFRMPGQFAGMSQNAKPMAQQASRGLGGAVRNQGAKLTAGGMNRSAAGQRVRGGMQQRAGGAVTSLGSRNGAVASAGAAGAVGGGLYGSQKKKKPGRV